MQRMDPMKPVTGHVQFAVGQTAGGTASTATES